MPFNTPTKKAKYSVLIHCLYGKWRNIFYFFHIFIYVFVSPILLLFILALFRKAAYRISPQTNNLQPFQCNTFPLSVDSYSGFHGWNLVSYFFFLFYLLPLLLLPFTPVVQFLWARKNGLFVNSFSFLLLVHFC